jgi:uncharacterized protein YjbI with pentapeptide repeats
LAARSNPPAGPITLDCGCGAGGAVLGGAALGGAVLGGAALGGAVLGGAALGGAALDWPRVVLPWLFCCFALSMDC